MTLQTRRSPLDAPPSPLTVGIAGCLGRMGRLLVAELLSGHYPDLRLVAATTRPDFPGIGEDVGTMLGQAPAGIRIGDDAEALFSSAQAVIDFTTPEASRRHAWLAAKHHSVYIVGTTGFQEDDLRELQDASREAVIVHAPNMSLGVTLITAMVEKAAAILSEDYDIEVLETHHRHKVDAPSGTALALGRAAATGRGADFESCAVHGRHGVTEGRERGEIGFAVRRGGDVVGQHSVSFFGDGETVTFSHTASNRSLFARGALRAAVWARSQPYGLYSMRDVLGL